MHRALLSTAFPLVLGALVAAPLPAQVPDGSFVVSAFRVGTFVGPAGLFVVDPQNGTAAPLSNLPPPVAGMALGSTAVEGPDFVVLGRDRTVISDGSAAVGNQLPVYFMTLAGSSVVSAVRYDVGTVTSAISRGLPQAQVLASGAVAVAVDDQSVGVSGEPLAGALLGILDPNVGPPGTPGTVTAVPIAPRPSGDVNAFVVDEASGVAYLAMIGSTGPTTLVSVPFPQGGATTPVAAMNETVTGLTLDVDGTVLASASGSGGLHRIDPATGNVTRIAPSINNLAAVTVERTTGIYFVATGAPSPIVRRIDAAGASSVVTMGPGGGWGTLDDIAWAPDPAEFGRATAAANHYAWVLAPNPGGAPTVGNLGFSLTIDAQPAAPTASAVMLSTGGLASPLSLLGVEIWIDPTLSPVTFPFPGKLRTTVPLRLPNDPTIRGFTIDLQSFHIDGGGFGATDAVRLTIL